MNINIQISTMTSIIISIILYFFLMITVWWIFSKPIISLLNKKYNETRFRSKYHKKRKKSSLYLHIEMLLNITLGVNSNVAVYTFFIISSSLFITFTIVLRQQSSMAFNLLFSSLFALLPYGYLVMKLRTYRVEGSYEGESLVAEILNQYKINYFNMIEALDRSIPFLENTPYTQKMLFRLSLKLKEYQTEEDIQNILKEFVYAVDTEWIKMLSNNIYLSIEEGINVSVGLDDILKELRQAKSTFEQNKRINTEGFAIIKILVPLMYLGTILVAVKYFDFTLQKFFNYQFKTATGFRFFIIMIGLFLLNVIIMIMFKKRKLDF